MLQLVTRPLTRSKFADVGDTLFVPIESWYQDGQRNPYAHLVGRLFVRCTVRRSYRRAQERFLEVYSDVYDLLFDKLGAAWVARWGTHRELPVDGIMLSQAHVNLYETPHIADDDDHNFADEDGAVSVGTSSDQSELPEEILGDDASDDEEQEEAKEDFTQGRGEVRPFPPFEAALQRHGWLTGAVRRSPGELVLNFVRGMLAWVVTCTNKRITREKPEIPPITFGELMRWHAIRILMSIIKLPNVALYWETPSVLSDLFPVFGNFMSYARFKQIKTVLRFEDYASNEDTRARAEEDLAWKIRTVTNLLRESFRKMMRAPGQHITVDEGMVRYTGRRCPIRRRLPNKPIPRGLKFFGAVDVSTGFLFDFYWDDSSLTQQNCDMFAWGMTGEVVLRLIRPLPGRGYVIYTDNYYTSVPLALELRRMQHHLVGTMRLRRGVPACVVLPSKRPTRATPRGTVRYSHNHDSSVHIYGWMDSGAVYLLDTIHGPVLEPIRRRVGATIQEFEVPVAYSRYNLNMTGVDRFDQIRTGYYGIEMSGRTAKWTIRAYEALFNMAVANSYALHKHLHGGLPSAEDHGSFMLLVAEEFLENVYDDPVQPRGAQRGRDPQNGQQQAGGNLDTIRHNLLQYPKGSRDANRRRRRECAACPNRENGRRVYSRRTSYYCSVCEVALHPECFDRYHFEKETPANKRYRRP